MRGIVCWLTGLAGCFKATAKHAVLKITQVTSSGLPTELKSLNFESDSLPMALTTFGDLQSLCAAVCMNTCSAGHALAGFGGSTDCP